MGVKKGGVASPINFLCISRYNQRASELSYVGVQSRFPIYVYISPKGLISPYMVRTSPSMRMPKKSLLRNSLTTDLLLLYS